MGFPSERDHVEVRNLLAGDDALLLEVGPGGIAPPVARGLALLLRLRRQAFLRCDREAHRGDDDRAHTESEQQWDAS